MKRARWFFGGLMVVMLFGTLANAEVINTYNGSITVTPGTITFGEVGTLLNASQMNGVGLADSYWLSSPTAQVAGSNIDHYWVQSGTNEIKWSLNTAVSAIYAIPGTDHGPLPMENMEYKMWASNDLTHWTVGTLTAIYADGYDPALGKVGESDAYATRWDFNTAYQYFKSVGTPGVVTGWTDYDPEMDGIAAVKNSPVPEPSSMLLLGSGLVGLVGYGKRKFKK